MTPRRDTRHNLLEHLGVEPSERDIIEEEERCRALNENVVDAVVHEIVSNRIVSVRLDRDLQLGADTVGTGHEDRRASRAREAHHAAKSAELPDRVGGVRRFNEPLDALFGRVRGLDVDARLAVIERWSGGFLLSSRLPPPASRLLCSSRLPPPASRLLHRSSSNATSLRKSATRAAMSRWSISSRRSIENFSTANDPSAEP